MMRKKLTGEMCIRDSFIIGNIDLVKEEIKKQQRLLSEMAADDEQMLVLFDLMTVVNELSNNGRITCCLLYTSNIHLNISKSTILKKNWIRQKR